MLPSALESGLSLMPRNVAQTRFGLIDSALEQRGWLRSDIRIEETAAPVDIVYHKGQRRAKGRRGRTYRPGRRSVGARWSFEKEDDRMSFHGRFQAAGASRAAAFRTAFGWAKGYACSHWSRINLAAMGIEIFRSPFEPHSKLM